MSDRPAINAMIELTALFRRRPVLGAPSAEVAQWSRAKGRLHERLAAAGGADSARESAYAEASFAHARRLEEQDGPMGWAA